MNFSVISSLFPHVFVESTLSTVTNSSSLSTHYLNWLRKQQTIVIFQKDTKWHKVCNDRWNILSTCTSNVEDVFIWFCLFLNFSCAVGVVCLMVWPAHWKTCACSLRGGYTPANYRRRCFANTCFFKWKKKYIFVCQCFQTSFLLSIPKTAWLLKEFPRVRSA